MNHLILYDAPCSLCNKAIRFVIKRDSQKKYLFAPLTGKTAQSLCNTISLSDDTLVLIENYETKKQRIYYRSKAVFKILWNLGGFWKIVGWKYILPSWMTDWAYRLIAKRRYQMCKVCPFKSAHFKKKGRFLP